MPEMGRLDRLAWAPIGAAWLWAAGVGVGLVGGIATLELNPLLAVPFALAWVYVGVRKPRVLGVAGALVGQGVAWIYLLATSGYGCASSCWWTLPYGPSHTEDLGVWRTQTWEWIGCSAILLILGIALTALLARRLRWQRAALRSHAALPTSPEGPRGRNSLTSSADQPKPLTSRDIAAHWPMRR